MSYYDKRSGNIILSEEDKEMFDEIKRDLNQPNGKVRTPIANNIIKWINEGNKNYGKI